MGNIIKNFQFLDRRVPAASAMDVIAALFVEPDGTEYPVSAAGNRLQNLLTSFRQRPRAGE